MGTFQSIEPASKQQQTNISLLISYFYNQVTNSINPGIRK